MLDTLSKNDSVALSIANASTLQSIVISSVSATILTFIEL